MDSEYQPIEVSVQHGLSWFDGDVDRSHNGRSVVIAGQRDNSSPRIASLVQCRPEQFSFDDIAGLLVPEVVLDQGRPRTCWVFCLQNAEGRRWTQPYVDQLTLPTGRNFCFHPAPGPTPTFETCWSREGIARWREPEQAEVVRLLEEIADHLSALREERERAPRHG